MNNLSISHDADRAVERNNRRLNGRKTTEDVIPS